LLPSPESADDLVGGHHVKLGLPPQAVPAEGPPSVSLLPTSSSATRWPVAVTATRPAHAALERVDQDRPERQRPRLGRGRIGAVALDVRVPDPVAMMAIMRSTIRPLAAADIAAVVEFSLRAWAPVFESFRSVLGERVYQALYPDWTTSQARAVEAVCQDDTAKVWVADQHGRPVGYVAVRIHPDDRTGEIEMLAVDPLVQCQGIGTALTSFAVQRLRDAGMRLAVVGTGGDPGHAAARRVYEKAGFVGLPLVRYYARLDTDPDHTPVLVDGGGGRATEGS
jgi:ribosomal protein S18 acetylase RimI-like enzyme